MPDLLPKEYNATFQQAQFLSCSPALSEILKPEGTVSRLAGIPQSSARVQQAFLAAYGRVPDAEEASQ